MHIHLVPKRGASPTVLLRESYRDGRKVTKRTLAHLSSLQPAQVETIRAALRGEDLRPVHQSFEILQSRAHGHVEAVAQLMRRLGVASVLAMVAARLLAPHPKLGTPRWWHTTTLADAFGVAEADEDELYEAMDWLLARQDRIQKKLAARQLSAGRLVRYDLSSSSFEGAPCPLATRGTLQVNYGILPDVRGCPVAVPEGTTADPETLRPEIQRLQHDVAIARCVLVGDRGMISQKAVDALRQQDGIGWITALKRPAIRALIEHGSLQVGLFDERNLFDFAPPDYPGERLVACRNPELATRRAHTREALLAATEQSLEKIRARVEAGRLAGQDQIGLRVGPLVNPYTVAKHFEWDLQNTAFAFRRNHPLAQTHRPENPPDPPSLGRAGAGPYLSVSAGLLCRMAPA
jgi:hypothetical protein